MKDTSICPKCGHKIKHEWLYCPACGHAARDLLLGDDVPLRLSTAAEWCKALDEMAVSLVVRDPVYVDECGDIHGEPESGNRKVKPLTKSSTIVSRDRKSSSRRTSQKAERPTVLHQILFCPDPFLPIISVVLPSDDLQSYVARAKQFGATTALIDWLTLNGWIDVWDCLETDVRRLRLYSDSQDGRSLSIPVFFLAREVSAEVAMDVFALRNKMSGNFRDEVIAICSNEDHEYMAIFQYDWRSGVVLEVPVEVET